MEEIVFRVDDIDNVRSTTTVHDVARAAGVSPMTVSRVLNGVAGAGAETRARVMREVERLGYRPNALAKGLKAKSSGTVALMVPDITNPFFPEIIRGAEDVAQAEGLTMLLCNVGEDPSREIRLLDMLESKRVDGVIVCSARQTDDALFKALSRHGSVVLVNRDAPHSLAGTIRIDYRAGAAQAIDHLVMTGRQRIGIIGGPLSSRSGAERLEGAKAALAAHGREPAAIWSAGPDIAAGEKFIADHGQELTGLDAVLCYNDLVGAAVLLGCPALGIRTPEDLAVVGFDDISLAAMLTPSLTSVRVDKTAIGRAAMRMLLDRRAGQGLQHGILVQPELIVRLSTGG
ncbi:MAG: LacI family DNA-binding transcriptional regulator [Beijerinckiaceae bacterium]